jgi:hypothetical protein
MPEKTALKKGLSKELMTTPMARVADPRSARATALGTYPSRAAVCRISSRLAVLMFPRPRKARETVVGVTCNISASFRIVIFFFTVFLLMPAAAFLTYPDDVV